MRSAEGAGQQLCLAQPPAQTTHHSESTVIEQSDRGEDDTKRKGHNDELAEKERKGLVQLGMLKKKHSAPKDPMRQEDAERPRPPRSADEATMEDHEPELIAANIRTVQQAPAEAASSLPPPLVSAAGPDFWTTIRAMMQEEHSDLRGELINDMDAGFTVLDQKIEQSRREEATLREALAEKVDAMANKVTDLAERLDRLELQGPVAGDAPLGSAATSNSAGAETRQGLPWSPDTLIIGAWPETLTTEQRSAAATYLLKALGPDLSHLPPRAMNQPGSVVKVRFETPARAARAQFLVELTIGKERTAKPELMRTWCALERPPRM